MNILKSIKDFLFSKPFETQSFTLLDDVEIVLMDYELLQKEYKKFNTHPKKLINGFALESARKIYIAYSGEKDVNGHPLPIFSTLGHELFHMKELGGRWHK